MSYNDIVEFMSRDTSLYNGEYWHFRKIIGHQRVFPNDPHYKGSSYNLRILWENNEITYEPLKIFAKDAPLNARYMLKRRTY